MLASVRNCPVRLRNICAEMLQRASVGGIPAAGNQGSVWSAEVQLFQSSRLERITT